ncbi:MAG: aldo/keto reductase [Novosphingobium sp. SCN 63-17]|nr:MAG: aldo/keto reductase [Novosphingobium sp. SCN 63-17]OJX95109.1 MAG: aldo/keto reductase [Novosphingobium sp. 63-713]
MARIMKTIRFPDGTAVPALGQGTWMMAENPARRNDEIAALREGVELGMTLIDTAEMYGEAIAGLRDKVFLVSKAYPHHASARLLRRSCEASLKRLGTDHLDLYLLHWRGAVPLGETVEAMERLVEAGLIARWGVSNLDMDDMEELIDAGGNSCATDQILYNLTRRAPELNLLPWLADRSMPVMAYSPVEQGRLLSHKTLAEVARRHEASPARIALAWLLSRPSILPIPKAGSVRHVQDNRAAADLKLSDEDIAQLERSFPRPTARRGLEML